MRKNLFAIIALSACALVACNKNEIGVATKPAGTVEMTVVAGDASTKTALSGSSIIWSGTEKLRVIEYVTGGDDDKKYFNKESSSGTTSDAGATMSFNVTLDTHNEGTGYKYAAVYPSSAFVGATSFGTVNFETPYQQDPSATSYDPAADMLISHVGEELNSQPTSVNMAFARKIAFGKMTVKNLATTDPITKVTFSAIDDATDVVLAGRSSINLNTSTVTYGANTAQKLISLDYTGDNVTLNSAAGAPLYFACFPFSLAAGDSFTVIVETATHTYTRTVTLTGEQTLAFTPGDVSRFSVNMSGITGVVKAASLHYAEFTVDEVYNTLNIKANTYTVFSNYQKTHGDVWSGKVNYYETKPGFGLRNASGGTNDSYLKLPDFADEISTVTVTLSTPMSSGDGKALLLETANNTYSGSIASIDAGATQLVYEFDVASSNITTAYLRAKGAPAYVKNVVVITKKTDTRIKLSAPTDITATLNGKTDIDVSWTKAADAIGYELTCSPAAGDPIVAVVGDVNSYKFESLANETTYTISIASIPDYYVNTKSDAANAASTVTTLVGATVATINFGNETGDVQIKGNSSSGTGTVTYTDSGKDSAENTWTITTVTSNEKSFTQNANYSQVGSSNKPVSSITFTTTLAASKSISAFSAKFGGFTGTTGTITLKVGSTTVGTGSLNAGTDVTVSALPANVPIDGTDLTVTITGIDKGVKCYYITCTYE